MSLIYDLRVKVLSSLKTDHDLTVRQYKKDLGKFAEYCKSENITKTKQLGSLQERVNLINRYVEHLESRGLKPDTIHTYIVPVCKALDINPPGKGKAYPINKPRRRALSIDKGRMPDLKNPRHLKDLSNPKYARAVAGAEILGLRRAEMAKVTSIKIEKDICGYDCVVIKGKGNKIQHQRILPVDMPRMVDLISCCTGNQRVFSKAEMLNKINFHSIRRNHAQKLYKYYCNRIKNGEADKLRSELLSTWHAYHPQNRPKQDAIAYKQFVRNVSDYNGVYKIRGDNLDRARLSGVNPCLNRLAIMCVSVFHLAHWRPDVTVRNYIL